jgi:Na+-driven multidrug efflux pump
MNPLLKRRDTNMTEGSIFWHLVLFAVPLLIGNIFQMLYNTVDSVVVGNFVGKEALAAVGSVTSIINMIIGFFMGLAAGASVVISQYYGARDEKTSARPSTRRL